MCTPKQPSGACSTDQARLPTGTKVPTTADALTALVRRLSANAELVAGQEVGKMSYFVHDTLTAAGIQLSSFNPYQLRMIASSRKKTDKRDAFWIAKALQTGMIPHPVYIPTGEIRQLRGLLSTRASLLAERTPWMLRAKSGLMAAGSQALSTPGTRRWIERALENVDGIEGYLGDRLELCERMHTQLSAELAELDAEIHAIAKGIDAIQRLQTIPAVGERVAVTLYAWVGDIRRFPNARSLAAYAGLVPIVRQSGNSEARHGSITSEGSKQLRGVLVQAGHVLLWRCQSDASAPLKALAERVKMHRGRRKIAVVAAARHILRIAFYLLRDETTYDPARLRSGLASERMTG